tara:strand:- start:3935 stop:4348 length:414 start_codon:yes stop_codon:yes gene_type:complete
MNIKENQEKAIDLFSRAPMKKTFNMILSYNQEDQAIFTMPFDQKFCHALGSMHGGVLSTLLDNAGWFTAQPYYENWINTIDLQVQLLLPTSNKSLVSKGTLVKKGKAIAFSRMEVFDEDDLLIATATGTFAVSNKKF